MLHGFDWARSVGCLLLTMGLVVACGPSVTEMPERAPCVSATSPDRYTLLVPTADRADGVRFFTTMGREATELTPAGRPCGGAKDPGACEQAVQGLVQATQDRSIGWPAPESGWGGAILDFAIVTRGDEVTRIDRRDALAELAAPITTPEEAVAVYHLLAGTLECGAKNMETTSQGWLFQRLGEKCDQGQNESISRVTRDGRWEPVSQHNVCAIPPA